MNCPNCGAEMLVTTGPDQPHDAVAHVVVAGLPVRRCDACRHSEIVHPRLEAMENLVAQTICTAPSRMSGDDLRYLRERLALSGRALATCLHADPATVSRWESGRQKMDLRAELLVRMWSLLAEDARDRFAELLPIVAASEEPRPSTTVRWFDGAWHREAGAPAAIDLAMLCREFDADPFDLRAMEAPEASAAALATQYLASWIDSNCLVDVHSSWIHAARSGTVRDIRDHMTASNAAANRTADARPRTPEAWAAHCLPVEA